MQTRSRQYMVVASVALGLVLAACSSSTAPAPISSTQLAKDFDAVFSSDLAGGTANDSNAAQLVAEFFELGPAYGGGEATFTATTASGTQTWHGVGFVAISDQDTAYVAGVYPNRDLQQAMFLLVQQANGVAPVSEAGASVTGLVSGADDSTATIVPVMESVGSGTCTLQAGLAAASVYADLVGASASCAPGTFQITFSVVSPAGAGLGALETMSGTVTINGPVLTLGSGEGRVVAIPSKGAALIAKLEAIRFRRGQ